MAIDLIKKTIITKAIKTKETWTSKEIQKLLNVSPSWITKNKSELESLGFKIERKEHKPHKQHANKGEVSQDSLDKYQTLSFHTDLFFNRCLLIKFAINKGYLLHNLPAVFILEGKENTEGFIKPEYYNVIEAIWAKEFPTQEKVLDFLVKLKNILNDQKSTKLPSNFSLYLTNLLNSLPYLNKRLDNRVLTEKIIKAFKEVHGEQFEPSDEQIQVIAKAELFANGIYEDLFVASIQSDAGTSKTHCAMVIQHLIHDVQPIITAITNKALDRIAYSKTVSSLLADVAGINTTSDTLQVQILKAEANKNKLPFIIVDESSQCGLNTRRLLETVSERVLYLGDQLQLPPIKDNFGVDLVYLHTLNKQYRFNEAEDDFQIQITKYNKERRLIKMSKLLTSKIVGDITGESYAKVNDESNEIEQKTNYNNSFENYIDLINNYKDNNSIIIAYAQSAVTAINTICNGGTEFKVGSKVMLINNDYSKDQYNGFQYTIEKIINPKKFLCTSIETGQSYEFTRSQLDLAYAITTMKCQGSAWNNVLGIDGTLKTLLHLDRYVIATRARISIKFLTVSKMVTTSKAIIIPTVELIHSRLSSSKEGSRNNTLYVCTKELIEINGTNEDFIKLKEIALSLGLTEEEIDSTINSARQGTSIIKTKKLPPSNNIILDSLGINNNPRLTQYYTPIFKNGKSLLGKDRILNKEEATNYEGSTFVGEELKGSNRIVIDCDSIDTVNLFKDYLDKTESYVSNDLSSAHLVFITNKYINSKHKENIDLLGNKLYTLRYEKPNKVYNGKKALELTQEVLDIWNGI